MNTHVCLVVVEQAEDGGIGMYFPDFPGTSIIPKDLEDGIWRAKELLAFRLLELEEKGEAFPKPSSPMLLSLRTVQTVLSSLMCFGLHTKMRRLISP
ncbi:type II toxin-antitoxin system HicB family antitoxin [Paenibacillus piscarius]|uniref:type II toxin-antitoxin system HicB family antitoxin n=1 Tax=Paenibacillus piscarius TaxID=1089681 RepID=UPI001EE8AABE|nr:type II toxin-antitoxin system HicB family antitoxin [Paenibacillus piscarius]